VRYGKNPNRFVPDEIRDVIPKHLQVHTPIPLWPKPWNFRIQSDPLNDRTDFLFQPEAQPGFDFLVICNRFG
jgi:hypothetical protein